jgi:diguanylate cyclase (GGDEF)-like protein
MDSAGDSATSQRRTGKVLLAGDISLAFLDADCAGSYPCDVKANILDAIEAAAQRQYLAIGVVIGGLPGRLNSVLTALRRCTSARIVLLAQMYEEPIARSLVDNGADEEGAADTYWVCPSTLASFCRAAQTKLDPCEETEVRSSDAALAAKIRHLERLATTDDLTGLRNRRYLWEFARQVLERARQTGGRVTLLVFDIDNFKHYNDVYGHPTGDEILRQAAILMQRCCRPQDVVGRIGGDEFAVVFWDDALCRTADGQRDRRSAQTDHPREVIFIARRFQNEFGHAELDLLGPEGQGVLAISGALASFPGDGATIQELFERADEALLEAKRSGKNRIYLVGEPQNNIADIP